MEGDLPKRKKLQPVLAVRSGAEPPSEDGPEKNGGVASGIRSRSKYLSRKKGDDTEEPGRVRKRQSFFSKNGDRFTGNKLFGFTLLAPGLENADPKGVEQLNKAMQDILETEGEVGAELLREAALPSEDQNENLEFSSMSDSFESVIIPVSSKDVTAEKRTFASEADKSAEAEKQKKAAEADDPKEAAAGRSETEQKEAPSEAEAPMPPAAEEAEAEQKEAASEGGVPKKASAEKAEAEQKEAASEGGDPKKASADKAAEPEKLPSEAAAASEPKAAKEANLSLKTNVLPGGENERLSSQLEKVPKAKVKKNKKNRRTGGSRIHSAEGRSERNSESKVVKESKIGENGKNKDPDFAGDLKDETCGKEEISPQTPEQEADGAEENGVRKGGSDMLPRDGEDYEIAGTHKMSSSAPVDREAGTRMVRGSKVMGMTRERAKKLELQFQQGVSGNDIHRARTAVNRRTGVNPPPRGGTRTGTRQNPPGFGSRTGMNQNPPGFGSRTGTHQNPPGFGSRTGMNQNPPGFGSRTGTHQNPPGFGSRTGMNQMPPGYGSRTGMNQMPPGYGSRTGMNQMPPGYGSRTGMNQMPPGYGSRTGMNQMPPGYGSRTGMNQAPPGYGSRPVLNQTPVFGRSTGLNQYNNSGYGNNRYYQEQRYREQPYPPANNGYGGYGYGNNGFNGSMSASYNQYPGGNYDINNGYTGVIPRNMPFRNNPQESFGGNQSEAQDMGMGREHLTPAETYAKAVEESQREGGRGAAFLNWLKNGGAVLLTCLFLIIAAICGFVMFVMSRTSPGDSDLLLPPKRPQYSQPAGRDYGSGSSGSSSIDTMKSSRPSASAPPAKSESASGTKSSGASARGNATVIPGSSAKPASPSKPAQPAKPSVTVKKTETRNSDFENNDFKFDGGEFGDMD
ncbi:hypothetical protein IJT93_01440 [bacterium]|nr:hypothetical protein [bacterium]